VFIPEWSKKGDTRLGVGSSESYSVLVHVQTATALPKPGHWPLFFSFSSGKRKYQNRIPAENT